MRHWFFRPRPKVPEAIKKNIASIAQLEQEFARRRTVIDVISDGISRFAGSLRFILAHVLLFAVWILLNMALPEKDCFDPYPFQFLGLLVGLEAVILSAFVLMSQNRQNRMTDQWAHVDLQVSLLSEQEMTKALKMLQRIHHYLGLDKETGQDKELKEMVETTHVEVLVKELAKAREPETPEEGPAPAAAAPAAGPREEPAPSPPGP